MYTVGVIGPYSSVERIIQLGKRIRNDYEFRSISLS